jgi:hypothetical protein
MEAEVVYVPYDRNLDVTLDPPGLSASPVDSEKTKEQVAKVKQMVADGWRIVSTVPIAAGQSLVVRGVVVPVTYTRGYEVWL